MPFHAFLPIASSELGKKAENKSIILGDCAMKFCFLIINTMPVLRQKKSFWTDVSFSHKELQQN